MIENRKLILNHLYQNEKYYIMAITEEENIIVEDFINSLQELPNLEYVNASKRFKKENGFKVEDIVLMGEARYSTEIDKYIPYSNITGYKCYAIEKPSGAVKIHETPKCSFNCIVQLLLNPTHLLIYKESLKNEEVITLSKPILQKFE